MRKVEIFRQPFSKAMLHSLLMNIDKGDFWFISSYSLLSTQLDHMLRIWGASPQSLRYYWTARVYSPLMLKRCVACP